MRFLVLALVSGIFFGQSRWVSHVTSSTGGFDTWILITNTGASPASYQIQPYTSSGSLTTVRSGTIQPGAFLLTSASSFFGTTTVSHFQIGSQTSADISIQVMYRRTAGGVAANVLEGGTSKGWKVFSGDWSYGWDGLAIVNTGTSSSQITIRQKDSAGNQIGSTLTTDLSAKAKFLYVLSNSFSGSRYFYEISGANELAITALRGDTGNTVLAGNPAVAIESTGGGQQTGNQYEDEVLLLKGHWYLTYTIISQFQNDYRMTSLSGDTNLNSEGAPFIFGYDTFGEYDTVGTYYPSENKWYMLDGGSTIDRLYVFKTNGSSIQSPACYYQVSPAGSTNLSDCYALSGYKSSTKAEGKGFLNPEIGLAIEEIELSKNTEWFEMPEEVRVIYQEMRNHISHAR